MEGYEAQAARVARAAFLAALAASSAAICSRALRIRLWGTCERDKALI
jgi:hypothetical protein